MFYKWSKNTALYERDNWNGYEEVEENRVPVCETRFELKL